MMWIRFMKTFVDFNTTQRSSFLSLDKIQQDFIVLRSEFSANGIPLTTWTIEFVLFLNGVLGIVYEDAFSTTLFNPFV